MLNFLKNKITGVNSQIANFQMMASSKDIIFDSFLREWHNLNDAITVGGKVSIRPGFGASSELYIIKPYSIVSSSDPKRGWGGWQHSFGHHSFVCCAIEGDLNSMPVFVDHGKPPIQFVPAVNKIGCFLAPRNFDSRKDYQTFTKLLITKYPSMPLNEDLIAVEIKNLYTVIGSNERGANWLEKNIQYDKRCDLTENDVLVIKLMYV